MTNKRADPTVAALLLIGFATLLFGMIGMLIYLDDAAAKVFLDATPSFVYLIGAAMLLFTFMAGKSGNQFGIALFSFVAVSFYAVLLALPTSKITVDFHQGLYLVAMFYIVFTAVAYLIGAPKILAVLLLMVAFLFFFVGLFLSKGEELYAMMFGIFGLAAFLISTYLGVALASEKLPIR